MGTFFSDPPVAGQGEVCQCLQASCYSIYRPVGQLGAGTDVQSLEVWLMLHQNLYRVVSQLLTAVQTQFLQDQILNLEERKHKEIKLNHYKSRPLHRIGTDI